MQKRFVPDMTVRAALLVQTQWAIRKANQLFPRADLPLDLPVEFTHKGTVAGRAFYDGYMKVSFNEVLAKENPVTFNDTVLHEVAHLVVRKLYGPFAKGHGREFKYVLLTMGGNGQRCHSYDVSSVKVTRKKVRYVCKCSCQEHMVTAKTITRLAVAYCKKCKSRLTYTGIKRTFN